MRRRRRSLAASVLAATLLSAWFLSAPLLSASAIGADAPVPTTGADAAETPGESNGPVWDVNAPPGDTAVIDIDVNSGTWMSVDVSPDGEHVVFDLLGDLYELPIEGGDARSLTAGLAWDMQPRYSPEGTRIVFTSDRAGGDNLWTLPVADPNAAAEPAPTQVSKEDFRLLNSPVWHPDGRYVAARKHFTTRRSLGTGEIWLYNAAGGGNGVRLVERPNVNYQKELGEPAFSPDGRYLYFTQNSTPGDVFEYAQDSNSEIFQIRRLELASGEIEPLVTGPGGAVRPTPSPNGRYLAFVRRHREDLEVHTALYLKDLESGDERLLYDGLDRDMQETWAVHGVYPAFAWTPDGASVVVWAGGGIQRIAIADGTVSPIPFRVRDRRQAIAPPRVTVEVAPADVESRMVRFASVSPDGRQVVFEAFGRLWLQATEGGEPRRLTRDGDAAFELFPAWSRDGKRIAFVRWTDAGLGAIHLIAGNGGRSRAVTSEPGHYRHPRFSPDGEMLVFERAEGGYLTSPDWSMNPGVYRMSADGGGMTLVGRSGQDPHFADDDARIYYTEEGPFREDEPAHRLVSVDLTGQDRRVHADAEYVRRIAVSPDGDWLAFRDNYQVFVTPMPPGGKLTLSRTADALPLRRASHAGGEFLDWSSGDTLTWTLGPELYRTRMADLFATPAPGSETDTEPPTALATLSVSQPADRPDGTIALTNARIVTMNAADAVIESGTVIIDGNRIAAVGAADEVTVPNGAERLDLAGRTIVPGLIDAHAHGAQGVDDLIPQQNWLALGHLGLGVTTVHDPSNRASEIFTAAEYQRAGIIRAPRMFSTGEIIYGARSESLASIETLEDARHHVQRLKAQGAISVKNYNQPRRDQRQMVVTAARESGLMSVAEGGSLYHMDMTIIADGNTGLEHNMPPQRFYDDVMQFWAATQVGYTPTLVVTYGGLRGEDRFYQNTDVWRHPLLSRFVPPHVLQPRSVRRLTAPGSDHQPTLDAAANAQRLMERGVTVNIGAHGQREGLGAHWEIWSFALGGMSPLQALATATRNPARYLGMERDLGSVERGKLADLLVLDGNPLSDIRVTDDIAYVIQNGRVFEAGSLDEVISGDSRLAPFYWEDDTETQ